MKKIISTLLITIIFLSTYNTRTMLAKRTMPTGRSMLAAIARTSNTSRNILFAQISPCHTTIRTITDLPHITTVTNVVSKKALVDKNDKKAANAKPVIGNEEMKCEKIKRENEIIELIRTLPNPNLTLEILLKFINDIDKDVHRALRHPAQSEQYIDIARFLLACHIHDIDEDGHTVLTWAAKNGKVELTKLLLANGENVIASDKDGMTALKWANDKFGLHAEITQILFNAEVESALKLVTR